ncbi:MAG: hypothetical protein JJE47_02125 [Acidimicrobiia bacterium]|nr:hypothetical protein [Acidimicrobiia bacterium]
MSDSPDSADPGSGQGGEPEADDLHAQPEPLVIDEIVGDGTDPEAGDVTEDAGPADDGQQPSPGDSSEDVAESFAVTDPAPAAETTQVKVISIWPIWAWTMVAVVTVVVALGIGAGVLSKTLLLDVVSFWPAFVVIALIFAALIPRLRKGAPRLSAVLPLLLLTYLGVTVALHVARWDELPSTSADVPGPEVAGVTDGRIELDLVGELVVRPADQPELYRILMLNRGGNTGVPSALEIITEPDASISVGQRENSGWFQSAGWDVKLSLAVTWEVEARADQVDINLAAVSSGGLTVKGDGEVVVGFVRPGSVIELDGTIDLVVRVGDHIDLVGKAEVPDGWSTTGLGRSTPGPSDPFTVIVIEGAIVTITER